MTCFNVPVKMQRFKKTDLLIVFLSTLPIYKPLLKPQFFWSHENAYFLWRLASFHQNVMDGAFFCRWFPDFARGLGLPFLEFYPVLPLYLSETFRLSGFHVIPSVKLFIVAVTLFAAVGGYLLGRDVWGRWGGLLTSVLISYAPYKMVNLYVRGDINELMAMAGLPWALWIVWRQLQRPEKNLFSLAAIAVFAIPSLSHYPSCVIQYPVLTLWIVCLSSAAKHRIRFLARNFLSLAAALAITSTFWLSAFMSRHLVQMEGMTQGFADYTKHFIQPFQWISLYWNFGASVLGPGDAMSFQLGNAALLAMLIAAPILFAAMKTAGAHRWAVIAALGQILISLFLMHSVSGWLWSRIPILPMLQFPYRILVIPAVMLPFLGGSAGQLIEKVSPGGRLWVAIAVMATVAGVSFYMCRTAVDLNVSADDLDREDIQRAAHTHCTGEYLPKPVGKRFPPPEPVTFTLEKIPENGFSRTETEKRLARWLETAPDPETWSGETLRLGETVVKPGAVDLLQGDVTIRRQWGTPVERSFNIEARSPGILRINQFYFQGWTATLNDRSIPLFPDPDTGLLMIKVPGGTSVLTVKYANLPLSRKLAWMGVILMIVLVGVRMYNGIRHGTS